MATRSGGPRSPAVGRSTADLPPRLDFAARDYEGAAVLRVDDRDEAVALIVDMVANTKREGLSALPAGPYPIEVLRSSWESDVAALRSGIRVLALYQADAVRQAEVLSYLTEFAAAGAQIRVARRVAQRMIIFDRRTGVLAVDEDTLRPPLLFIREPALVRQMVTQYSGLWRSAHSVGTGPEDSLAVDTVRDVVRALADGLSDSAAARRLGISERTLRRRVAAVLDLLGATSRFEAGVKAVQHGWL